MARTLLKAKGRWGSETDRFARMTDDLLQHVSVTTLSHSAFRVLTILTVGARAPRLDDRKDKGRNGVQAITASFAAKYGVTSRDTVYRALEDLLERQLIINTRVGHKSKAHFALYAVAWLPITHRDGQPLGRAEPPPLGFLNWEAPVKRKKRIGKRAAILPSDDRTQSRPINGRDASICRPTMSTRFQNCRPMVGTTLRVLGVLPTDSCQAADLESKPLTARATR